LRELRDEGIVARQSFNKVPPRVEYSLTEEGWRLREAILPLMEWAGRHPRAAVVPAGVEGA
jgi:DNA-binding HxlR family transcriptional regulator